MRDMDIIQGEGIYGRDMVMVCGKGVYGRDMDIQGDGYMGKVETQIYIPMNSFNFNIEINV